MNNISLNPTTTLTPLVPSLKALRPKAKRLISTKAMSRQEWLQTRRQGIGSSDAAAACGLNPHMSMLELWMLKTGRIAQSVDQTITDHYSPLYWGNQLEPLIAHYYRQKTGHRVHRVNAILQHPDPDYHFMLANLDYRVTGTQDIQILECKSVGEWGTKHWREGVPLYVLIQVQHQLAVTGEQAAHICVLICGHEAKIYKVERNEQVIQQLMASEKVFWECVEKDIPPAVDASDSSAKALQLLYPEHRALETVDFTGLEEVDVLFTELLQQSQHLANHQSQYDQLKHQIQALMKHAEKAIFSAGSVTWKKSKDSLTLDSKRLLQDQPELLAQYAQSRQGTRRFNCYPSEPKTSHSEYLNQPI